MKIKLLLVSILLLLAACGSDEPNIKSEKSSPEYNASLYFHSLLQDKDIKTAMAISVPKHARIMKSYGSAKQYARNVLNMKFDTVEIEIDHGSRSVRKTFGDSAVLNVIITGKYNGHRVTDARKVKMIKHKGQWYVEKVLADPYAR